VAMLLQVFYYMNDMDHQNKLIGTNQLLNAVARTVRIAT